ncbi:Utp14-domain-containing protein [Lentinula aff. lateritia]|uniref:Utp14-domain-containing protein n=1 Tax=Lentinula aff. lateritia TaxID=2804960 RepID=A0ACC1TRM9_9AGAR|nr:Utp14-domain-containing protein [Lentinula aff. lateritia]
MARSGRTSSNNQSRPTFKNQSFSKRKSSAATAASGYAKRHERKAAKFAGRFEDVYEYAPEKVRRSKIALDLDRDEEMDAGPLGNGGEDDMEDIRMKARLIGENEEDEKIDSEDDEEIDSDAAFDDDDDERFAGFFTKKVLKKKASKQVSVTFADVDLNEDEVDAEPQESERDNGDTDSEDGEESGEDDEFINVLDILDGRGEPLNDEDNDAPSASFRGNLVSAEGGDEEIEDITDEEDEEDVKEVHDEDEVEEDDRISISLSEAEDEADGALDDLQTFISSLDPTSSGSRKRKADGEEPDPSRKRRVIKERTEAGVESEFRTQSAGLSLNDLLSPLGQSSLEKSVKVLQSQSGGNATSSGKRKKPQTLSVPLPQRAQERLDREAAYEQTKEEVDKWSATMKRISEADHLSFPLQAQPQGKVSNLELAAKFKPSTALETTVSSFLSSANLATDASVLETEENILKTNAISVEDVAERRRELRQMRELMFRAEVKAKRVKKIKSKVYRRLKRKEKEAVDGNDDGSEEELTEERRLKVEMERARERATLKHKNTGKWAKKMMSRGAYGEGGDDDDMRGGRQEIEEMLSRGEKLRRKIQGRGSDDDDSQSENEDGGEDDPGAGVESAFNELKALSKTDADPLESEGKKGKSVFEMKFMKDAMARKQAETSRIVDDFVKEMGRDEGHLSDGEIGSTQDDPDSGVIVSRTGGRMVLQPTAKGSERPTRTFSVASEETSSSTLKSTDFPTLTPPSPLISTSEKHSSRPALSQPFSSNATTSTSASVNPWLVPSSSSGAGKAGPKKKNEIVVDKDSSQTTKSKHKLKKQNKKTEEEKARVKDDAVVEIEIGNVLAVPKVSKGHEGASATSAVTASKNKNKLKGKGKAQISDDDSGSNDSEVEEQEKMLRMRGKKLKATNAFKQRELVARAFAGDNVVKEFEEAKSREIAMDAPTEVDTTLPGWGSWGGNGVRKGAPKPHLIKKIAGIDPKSRADYNKAHVIISEKRDKKASKYLVPDLPYPYTSKAQFDRRMQQPLGPEWNTRVGFQRGTLPKVVKKMGTIIDPLDKLS